ncbi:hypothetical protein Dsin_025131 [Dipteronia sinensis]|uniref:RNase H type-1 domain-containing protein n=1 Tax=Dipteronia sinensis TaxID=43782 RepID=A0AAD9ZVU3_9ROSI|nr:hypothetical protein Dsin_025131 [Dipteronia sinensis]
MHARGCPSLNKIRVSFPSLKDLRVRDHLSFLNFMISCKNQAQREVLELLCMVLLRIWFRRNCHSHNSAMISVDDIRPWAEVYIADFRKANSVMDGPLAVWEVAASVWKPNDVGLLKLNTDATLNEACRKVGTGAVIRDSSGAVLASCAHTIPAGFTPLVDEAMAVRNGLQFAKDSGHWPVLLRLMLKWW